MSLAAMFVTRKCGPQSELLLQEDWIHKLYKHDFMMGLFWPFHDLHWTLTLLFKEFISLLHCGTLTMPLDQLDIKSHRSNEAKCHAPIKTSSCSQTKLLNKNDRYP